MTLINYAFVKNNIVVNVAIFDDPTEELLNIFKEENNLDLIIPANEISHVGGEYDGIKFWPPRPYNSWIKNEELNEWESPIPYPQDGEQYIWDEPTTSWLLLPTSN